MAQPAYSEGGLAYESVAKLHLQTGTAFALIFESISGSAPFTSGRGLRTSHGVSFGTRLVSSHRIFSLGRQHKRKHHTTCASKNVGFVLVLYILVTVYASCAMIQKCFVSAAPSATKTSR